MKYFFDVTETFVRTFAVEASDILQANQRIETAYHLGELEIEHDYPNDYEFSNETVAVRSSIRNRFIAEDEIETLNCHDVVYDKEMKAWVCPVCGNYAADKGFADEELPKYCHECGTQLRY